MLGALFEDPEEQKKLQAFLLVWCLNLVERVVRLRQYVSERKASIPSGSPEPYLLDILLEENDGLAKMLQDVVRDLVRNTPSEISQSWVNYYSELKGDIPKDFRKLHRQLWLIPSPWPRPELELFIQRALEPARYRGSLGLEKQRQWTILLTGDFNFADILVSELPYAPQRYGLGKTEKQSFSEISTLVSGAVTIPGVERDNPVAWLNLIHELGHRIGDADGIVEKAKSLPNVKRLQSKDGLAYTRLRDHWISEIVADLIATDLLGIGYYASFVEFATFWAQESTRIPLLTHPPVEARRQYIYDRLNSFAKITDDFRDELDNEYNMRLTLDYQSDAVRPRIHEEVVFQPNWVTELVEVAQEIVSQDEYKAIFPHRESLIDVCSLKELAEHLGKYWPIASRPLEATVCSIEEIEADQKKHKLRLVQTTTNDIREIIGAASLAKRRQSRQDCRKLLFSFIQKADSPVRDCLIRLWENFHKLDIIVTKSVEAAEIVKFYQSSKAYSEMMKKWMES